MHDHRELQYLIIFCFSVKNQPMSALDTIITKEVQSNEGGFLADIRVLSQEIEEICSICQGINQAATYVLSAEILGVRGKERRIVTPEEEAEVRDILEEYIAASTLFDVAICLTCQKEILQNPFSQN